jgi:hypothetical protein
LVVEDDAEECVEGRASGSAVEVVRNPQTRSVPTTTRASRGFVRSFAERPGSRADCVRVGLDLVEPPVAGALKRLRRAPAASENGA